MYESSDSQCEASGSMRKAQPGLAGHLSRKQVGCIDGQGFDSSAFRSRFEQRIETLDLSEAWLSGQRRRSANAEGAD